MGGKSSDVYCFDIDVYKRQVVKLPDGTAMNSDNRVTVTVKDQNGEAKENVNVIAVSYTHLISDATSPKLCPPNPSHTTKHHNLSEFA